MHGMSGAKRIAGTYGGAATHAVAATVRPAKSLQHMKFAEPDQTQPMRSPQPVISLESERFKPKSPENTSSCLLGWGYAALDERATTLATHVRGRAAEPPAARPESPTFSAK